MIQAIYPFEDRAAVVCNDEGILLGCRTTEAFPADMAAYWPVFVCGLGEETFAL